MNVSLACDYRIVTDNTVFQKLHLELGLVPKGGCTFFLSKMLGMSKAAGILLSSKDITAQEAMRLGMVDKVVPLDKIEETALKVAQYFTQKPARSLTGVKRLLNYPIDDLRNYLEFENEELFKIVASSDFKKTLAEYNEADKDYAPTYILEDRKRKEWEKSPLTIGSIVFTKNYGEAFIRDIQYHPTKVELFLERRDKLQALIDDTATLQHDMHYPRQHPKGTRVTGEEKRRMAEADGEVQAYPIAISNLSFREHGDYHTHVLEKRIREMAEEMHNEDKENYPTASFSM